MPCDVSILRLQKDVGHCEPPLSGCAKSGSDGRSRFGQFWAKAVRGCPFGKVMSYGWCIHNSACPLINLDISDVVALNVGGRLSTGTAAPSLEPPVWRFRAMKRSRLRDQVEPFSWSDLASLIGWIAGIPCFIRKSDGVSELSSPPRRPPMTGASWGWIWPALRQSLTSDRVGGGIGTLNSAEPPTHTPGSPAGAASMITGAFALCVSGWMALIPTTSVPRKALQQARFQRD